jgi:hypothetical protein
VKGNSTISNDTTPATNVIIEGGWDIADKILAAQNVNPFQSTSEDYTIYDTLSSVNRSIQEYINWNTWALLFSSALIF